MDANPYALKQVLTLERRYVVPTFQRDYEWSRDEQWSLLFDDLEAVARRLDAARAHAMSVGQDSSRAERNVPPHFLGAVVLDQLPSPAGGLDVRAIIDGQQRLTTLQLLLRGVLDVLTEIDSGRARQVTRLLRNPEDVIESTEERHKLWPRRRDREAWELAMSDEVPANTGHAYLDARGYFAERTRTAVDELEVEEPAALLVDALIDLFKLVVIDLEDNDDAQVIFEVLNGRQTPLSAADLVKNLLFLRAEVDNTDHLEDLYDEYWAPFDEEWWKTEIGRGHAARRHSDMLLASWLSAVSGEEASPGRLYGQVRRYLDSDSVKVPDVLKEISTYASDYRVVQGVADEPDDRLRLAYERLRVLGITTALPLLLWLRSLPLNQLPATDHTAAVTAVESWVVRRAVTGQNTRGYAPVFRDVLREAQKAAKDPDPRIAARVRETLAGGPHNRPWPTDSDLIDAFTARRFYGNDSQQRIRLLLGALDAQLREEDRHTESALFDYESLTVEHVMPQSWRDHWPLEAQSEAEAELAGIERDRAVNRVGNLTLVTSSLNPTMSNGPWSEKREALREHSDLRLPASIVSVEDWNEDAMDRRGKYLAGIAARVWPGPPAVDSDRSDTDA